MSNDGHNQVVVFLHIAKTAGSTLNEIIKRHYDPKNVYTVGYSPDNNRATFRQLPKNERNQYQLVSGHMHYGVHQFIERPCQYFTFFRDPVERIVSYYTYIKRNPTHYMYERIVGQRLSLQAWVETIDYVALDNGQLRNWCDEQEVPVGECTESMLQSAKKNLSQHCAVIGLTERFDESLLLLRRQFGWRHLHYKRRNVSANRVKVADLSAEVLQLIREKNRFDIALYQFAHDLFEEKVRQGGVRFQWELAAFRRWNQFYQRHGTISLRFFLQNKLGGWR